MHQDILKQIRRRFPWVPVFIFTNETSESEKNKILQFGGARDFLRKDLDEMEIQRQLKVFQQLALDQNRIELMKSLLAGQANGFNLELSPPRRAGDTLTIAINNVRPSFTPRSDDLGLYTQKRSTVRLADVQGIAQIRTQVVEIIDIVKNSKSYFSLGATLPKGLLLYGPPGTGKTMLAEAIAYETGAPFLHTSSAVLATRYAQFGDTALKAFFDQARRNAPCLVFIDEIDGIGQKRTGLDQSTLLHSLLTGIDSIPSHDQVLFVAATNRPEILDPALTRPGRFDRNFAMEPPSVTGREAILRALLASYDATDLDVTRIAQLTSGFTGAQLANLLNESALAAKRLQLAAITPEIVEQTIDFIRFGPEAQPLSSREDRLRVAAHELGHGILTLVFQTDKLHRVSIINRADILGISETLPEERAGQRNRLYWLNKIAVCLGGRVAEQLLDGEMEGQAPGAESDFEKATRIAKRMVCQWGMAPNLKGCLAISTSSYLGDDFETRLFSSEHMAQQIDEAVQQLLQQGEALAVEVLGRYRERLRDWAGLLLDHEEISGEWLAKLVTEEDSGVSG